MRAQQNIGGLVVKKDDPRTFSYHKTFGSVFAPLIPSDFDLFPGLEVKDQGYDDTCTARAIASGLSFRTHQDNSAEYQFYKTKFIAGGDWRSFGANPDDACKAAIQYGLLDSRLSPFTFGRNADRNLVANPENWKIHAAELDRQAANHKQYAFYKVDGPFDMFDNIRSALYQMKQAYEEDKTMEPCGVFEGMYWQPDWLGVAGGVIPNRIGKDTSLPHMFFFRGSKTVNNELHLVAHLSSGTGVGDKGMFYFPREVVNKMTLFTRVIREGTIDDLKREQWSLLQKLYDTLVKLVQALRAQLVQPKPPESAPFPIQPTPALPPESKSKYSWGTPAEVRHSIRVICDEAQLSLQAKDTICAVIRAESGFDTKKISEQNKNGTRDYGICQFNDGKNKKGVPYWIGEGADFASRQEVLDNPEKCVRVMIREYKKYGYPKWWSSYLNDSYKKYL